MGCAVGSDATVGTDGTAVGGLTTLGLLNKLQLKTNIVKPKITHTGRKLDFISSSWKGLCSVTSMYEERNGCEKRKN